MVRVRKSFRMAILIKANIKIIDLMVLELIHGSRDKLHIKGALKMVSGMEKVNGHQVKRNILEVMLKDLSKGMGNFTFQVEIFTKEIFLMISDKDMGKCFGQTDLFIKVIGKEECKMVKAKFI